MHDHFFRSVPPVSVLIQPHVLEKPVAVLGDCELDFSIGNGVHTSLLVLVECLGIRDFYGFWVSQMGLDQACWRLR